MSDSMTGNGFPFYGLGIEYGDRGILITCDIVSAYPKELTEMGGKPDGKHRSTKKSRPARKAAKREAAFGKRLREILTREARRRTVRRIK